MLGLAPLGSKQASKLAVTGVSFIRGVRRSLAERAAPLGIMIIRYKLSDTHTHTGEEPCWAPWGIQAVRSKEDEPRYSELPSFLWVGWVGCVVRDGARREASQSAASGRRPFSRLQTRQLLCFAWWDRIGGVKEEIWCARIVWRKMKYSRRLKDDGLTVLLCVFVYIFTILFAATYYILS